MKSFERTELVLARIFCSYVSLRLSLLVAFSLPTLSSSTCPCSALLPRLHRPLPPRLLNMRRHLRQPHIAAIQPAGLLRRPEQEVHREADFKRIRGVDLIEVLVRQLDLERVDVALQVRRLAAADDGEDVGRLVHDVGQAVHANVSENLCVR